jgi:hypothetical protein
MKNVLIFVLCVWMFLGGAGVVLAQEAEVSDVPSTRFGLFVEHWKDRLSLWVERDDVRKAELEANIAEKYQTWEEKINNLPESVNKEVILQTMETRKEEYIARLEQRVMKKEEVRSRFEVRLNELQGKGEVVRDRVENRATDSATLIQEREGLRDEMEKEKEDMKKEREDMQEEREGMRQERQDDDRGVMGR